MSQKEKIVDCIIDLVLIRCVYKELDYEFTVQDLLDDPRYTNQLKDPPEKSKGRTINGAASGVVSRMTQMGLLFNVSSKKIHGGRKKRVYRINRPLLMILRANGLYEHIELFDVVKKYYNNCRMFFKKEYQDKIVKQEDTE